MKQEQDDITTAFETTGGFLDKNSSLWSGIPAFADAVGRAKAGTAAIRGKAGGQAATGDAEAKAAARDALEERRWR